MKKRLRNLMSVIMTTILIVTMGAMQAFAATASGSSTVPDNGHTYEVYQIFTGELHEGVLSNLKWGKNGTGTQGTAVPQEVIDALEAATAAASDTAKLEVIERYVNLESTCWNTVNHSNPLRDVPLGYYLIKDKDIAFEDDVATTYVVKVVGNVDLEPKSDKPTITKKVKDTNDSTGEISDWIDSVDYDIGDLVPFQLTGTVAHNYGDYSTYRYVFHDKASDGLTFMSDSVKIYIDGTLLDSAYDDEWEIVYPATDGDTFDIVFANLKNIPAVRAGSVITVEFKARLNENAVIGYVGNINDAALEYSNNPNTGQEGSTSKTPYDRVRVFTYRTIINKVDEKEVPLAGADFKLYKLVVTDNTEEWREIEVSVNAAGTVFTFDGLDDGRYKLVETVTPSGYNSIDDIYFTVNARHEFESDDPKLIELTVTETTEAGASIATGEIRFTAVYDEDLEAITATVINQSGAVLPETGGTGTKVFYLLGGCMVAGAVILLVTRKRLH